MEKINFIRLIEKKEKLENEIIKMNTMKKSNKILDRIKFANDKRYKMNELKKLNNKIEEIKSNPEEVMKIKKEIELLINFNVKDRNNIEGVNRNDLKNSYNKKISKLQKAMDVLSGEKINFTRLKDKKEKLENEIRKMNTMKKSNKILDRIKFANDKRYKMNELKKLNNKIEEIKSNPEKLSKVEKDLEILINLIEKDKEKVKDLNDIKLEESFNKKIEIIKKEIDSMKLLTEEKIQNKNKIKIEYNAEKGKYSALVLDENDNKKSEESIEAVKKWDKKHIKEILSNHAEMFGYDKNRYNKILNLVDYNIIGLLKDNEDIKNYYESLLEHKEKNNFRTKFLRKILYNEPAENIKNKNIEITYNMRSKQKEKDKFIDKFKMKRLAKRQEKLDFAKYIPETSDRKNSIIAIGAAAIIAVSAIGGNFLHKQTEKDNEPKMPITDTLKLNDEQNKEKDKTVTIGTKAEIKDAKYYYNINKSKPMGKMNNLENKNIQIKYFAVKNSDGTFKTYNEKDNIDINKLKEQNPESEIWVGVGNVEKDGVNSYNDIGWMNYDEIKSNFEKEDKQEKVNEQNKNIEKDYER